MTVYVFVQLKMNDRAACDRYQARFFDEFRKFSERLLSADENPRVLEGVWDRDKLVLMSFPDAAACHAWANSPDIWRFQQPARQARPPLYCWRRGSAPAPASLESPLAHHQNGPKPKPNVNGAGAL